MLGVAEYDYSLLHYFDEGAYDFTTIHLCGGSIVVSYSFFFSFFLTPYIWVSCISSLNEKHFMLIYCLLIIATVTFLLVNFRFVNITVSAHQIYVILFQTWKTFLTQNFDQGTFLDEMSACCFGARFYRVLNAKTKAITEAPHKRRFFLFVLFLFLFCLNLNDAKLKCLDLKAQDSHADYKIKGAPAVQFFVK